MTLAPDRPVADAAPASWVARAPAWLRPYLRLARYDRPIGFWLLGLPCFAGMALAQSDGRWGWSDLGLGVLFVVGALAMRGAGCTYNDIIDKDLDARVARTAQRPLAAGAVSRRAAWIFLVAQAVAGLGVLLALPRLAQLIALASLPLVAAYPFMKRITWWPQAWLGLTFNWGALVGYAAVAGRLDAAALTLYGALAFWTLGYDTIYAHQDTEDDALVGVKSTALLFGARSRAWIAGFYALTAAGVAVAAALAFGLTGWHVALAPFMATLGVQVLRTDFKNPGACLAMFKFNRITGLLMIAGLAAAAYGATA